MSKKSKSGTLTVYDENGKAIEVDQAQFEASINDNGTNQAMTNKNPSGNPPQVVYMTRPLEPLQPHISENALKRHEESKKKFPFLNLSNGEYVVSAIRRHPIGLLGIWGVVMLAIAILIVGIFVIVGGNSMEISASVIAPENTPTLAMIFLGLVVLMFLGGVMATIVYQGNRFFLTNESVTQHIQISLFSKKEQTISLSNIEDASFRQHGITQHMLNYGTLRLSTEGDETTYRFSFVENPAKQIAILNNAVEAFKNGRPVDPDEN